VADGEGEEEAAGRRGGLEKNSDARRGYSHVFIKVRDVECEGHEKRWTEM